MEDNFKIEWMTTIFGIPATISVRYNRFFEEDKPSVISFDMWSLRLYASCFPKEILDAAVEEIERQEKLSIQILDTDKGKMANNIPL